MTKTIPWVFLRGLSREHRHWGEFPDIFKQYFPDTHILTPDLPGNGLHYRVQSPGTITEILEFIREELGSKHYPVNLLALSMGAMVSLEWMTKYPDECQAGVFINTSIKGINPFKHRLRPENYGRIIKDILLYRKLENKERCILELTSRLYDQPEILLQEWLQIARSCPVSRRNILYQLMAASRYKAPGTKPCQPLFLLNSLADKLVNPLASQRISEYWNLPLASHPKAGHDLPLDDPHWVCQQIRSWMANPG